MWPAKMAMRPGDGEQRIPQGHGHAGANQAPERPRGLEEARPQRRHHNHHRHHQGRVQVADLAVVLLLVVNMGVEVFAPEKAEQAGQHDGHHRADHSHRVMQVVLQALHHSFRCE
jgi:hypothetical protein